MVLFAITNQQDGQQESFQREEIEALHQNYKERQQGDGTKRSAPDGETNQHPSKKRNRSIGKDTEKGDSSPGTYDDGSGNVVRVGLTKVRCCILGVCRIIYRRTSNNICVLYAKSTYIFIKLNILLLLLLWSLFL